MTVKPQWVESQRFIPQLWIAMNAPYGNVYSTIHRNSNTIDCCGFLTLSRYEPTQRIVNF